MKKSIISFLMIAISILGTSCSDKIIYYEIPQANAKPERFCSQQLPYSFGIPSSIINPHIKTKKIADIWEWIEIKDDEGNLISVDTVALTSDVKAQMLKRVNEKEFLAKMYQESFIDPLKEPFPELRILIQESICIEGIGPACFGIAELPNGGTIRDEKNNYIASYDTRRGFLISFCENHIVAIYLDISAFTMLAIYDSTGSSQQTAIIFDHMLYENLVNARLSYKVGLREGI